MSKSYYFFLYYPRNEKEKEKDIEFVEPEEKADQPECIFSLEEEENGIFHYKKIFKATPKDIKGKKSTSCHYEFENKQDIYIISFKKNNTFVFDVDVVFGNRALDIKRPIEQTNIKYIDKLNYFIEALEENKEEDKIDELFKDALSLYSNLKLFSFLTSLFLKIYQKKELCSELIGKFKEMNSDPKQNEKNFDRKDYLKDYTSKFNEIISEADKLVTNNNYDSIAFYGVMLCYLNFYDFVNFTYLVDKLSKKKPEDLYEIILIYNKHLINPIKQNFEFLNKFICYIIKNKNKSFEDFKIGLNYIKEIEIYTAIIAENRKDIFEKYIKSESDPKKKEKYYIELGKNLKFKKTENDEEESDDESIERIREGNSTEGKENSEEEGAPPINAESFNISVTSQSETKEIVNKNVKKNKTPKSDDNDINNKRKQKKIIEKVLKNIEEILSFCDKNGIFLAYFTNDFWKYILYHYKEPTEINIEICFKIRKVFVKYYNLVIKIFGKKKSSSIKKDAQNYFDNDEFAFLLDDIIKQVIKNSKTLKNIEKLNYITKYNPYYIEPHFHEKVDSDIFNSFDLNEIDDLTITDFRKFKFENVFKGKINDFIREFISKIKHISNFDTVIRLINFKRIKKIEPKGMKKFLEFLDKKYDDIIQKEIESLTYRDLGKLNQAKKVVADLAILYFTYGEKDHKLDFEKEKIKKLQKKIIPLIFIEIISIYIQKLEKEKEEEKDKEKKDEEEKKDEDENEEKIDLTNLKDYIFEEFVKKVEDQDDIDNIIKLIECIEGKQKEKKEEKEKENSDTQKINSENNDLRKKILNEFLDKLYNEKSNNLFSKEEFFTEINNIKVSLLCSLYEKEKIENDTKLIYFDNINKLLTEIRGDLDGNIRKETLEKFLKIDKSLTEKKIEFKHSIINRRLNLMKLILEAFNPETKYCELKNQFDKIDVEIKKLQFTKDNIIIYFNQKHQELLQKLIEVINNNKNKEIKQYKEGRIKTLLDECENLEVTANKIEKVKNFLLFNIIYEMNSSNDEDKNFDIACKKLDEIGKSLETDKATEIYEKYKDIFEKIREKISNNEEKAQQFIKDLKEYYKLENEDLIEKLTILFKSKKFEKDINSIIFFFSYFEKNNKKWNEKLSIEKYKDLSKNSFEDIITKLGELKKNEIYIYNDIKNYNKLFTCLNEKEEAIEFLFEKIGKDISYLKDRIQPSDKRIKIQNIIDTEQCITKIEYMNRMNDNFKIFFYIKNNLRDEEIEQFENYSKKFSIIIELDRFYDSSEDYYLDVKNIIGKEFTIKIDQDSQSFLYVNEKNENKTISLRELIMLKNKLHNINEKENENENENKTSTIIDNNKEMKIKRKNLLFFKKIITNIELIVNEYMKALRTKGSSLPIKIMIEVKNDNIKYYLGEQETYLEKENPMQKDGIKDFLIKAKDDFITKLNEQYKQKMNLRFIYGKQFRSMMKHLETGLKIEPFLRYILNFTDNNKNVNEGLKAIDRSVTNWINNHIKYEEDSFKNINNYINSLFANNNKKFYDKMIIIPEQNENKEYKGIYTYECETNFMEEFIIKLFWNKLIQLPIAQNVLITSNETTEEEIQAFLNRAILCNYNSLFVVEISDSFSEQQQSIMNSYIDKLLTHKKRETKCEKSKTQEYMDSCLLFIYGKEYKNNLTTFSKEIIKLEKQEFEIDIIKNATNKNNKEFLSELGNVQVFTSDICGLGKSGKIKKLIEEKKQKYFHFPLGGILTKDIIFEKLKNLLKKIKDENFKDVAIHLDLTESREKSIMNEFLFSFLITKFYSNSENIIYIPKDIFIYVEIPNCFEDYISKFNLLKIFKRDNITFETMPKYNYPSDMIEIFKRMLEIDSNEKIKAFVEKHIGIKKPQPYSFHQINIFIKLFISQYNKFKSKLIFLHGKKDVTEECISEFAKCTQYFTNGGFAKLIAGIDKNSGKDYIDELSEKYDNDLKKMTFETPLIFIIKEKMIYDKFYVPTKKSNDYKSSENYLQRMKELLNIPNEVEKDEGDKKSLISIVEQDGSNYVITNDNFKKMILLIYRIKANVPVIIMGETGCGKTALITKLNQILNNGKTTVEIINIHPGIDDELLCQIMDGKDKKAREQPNEELWLFFDEINTCKSLSLLTEIFINRTYFGKKISDNIRLIGACNPYRKRKGDKEKCGLSFPDDTNNDLVYIVEPLPQSLLYYVFSFGSIDEEDEKKYIYSIIAKLFTSEEKQLHEITKEAISQCHIYLRNAYDSSVVSLREISRFTKCVEFFKDYFTKKNKFENRSNDDKNNKIRSIICSLYLCYYIRLTNPIIRYNFDVSLRPILLQLINGKKVEETGGKIIEQIINENFKNEITFRKDEQKIENNFSDFIKVEQDYLINQIELEKGIGKNTLLKENVFLSFVSVVTNIPLIIVGKPGCGKSLSAQLIKNSMKGKYSNKKFFKLFPRIIQTYFQGSDTTFPQDVENLFKKASDKLKYYNEHPELETPISLALFDELGLAERSKYNPLKVLHSKLEYAGKDKNVGFIGISNYSLDAAKVNRALVLTVPDLDRQLDELKETAINIVESITPRLKNHVIFEILSNTYFEYKELLQTIKELIVYKKYKEIKIKEEENNEQREENLEKALIQKEEEPKEIDVKDDKNPSNLKKALSITTIEGIEEKKNKEKEEFEAIKTDKLFKQLLLKEHKIQKDFHGNRDFYNLIRGIANDLEKLGDSSDKEKIEKIIKYIERNFGGIKYNIDIDYKLKFGDMENQIIKIENILSDYNTYIKGKPCDVSSVFLFKKLYNLSCENKNSSNLKIDKYKINDYNLNDCIRDNINDSNGRYLLMEIKKNLTPLIYQNIKIQNPLKDIIIYEGSPFGEDNNKEYRYGIINQIQNDAKDPKIILIENLDQIHAFLFDLYNMNYQIIEDKKYARVCLDNFDEQLVEINSRFRIIILVENKFVKKCSLAFLNRLEKINVSFDKLLDKGLETLSKNLIEELNLIKRVEKYNFKETGFLLNDLLINCKDDEIQGLIYNLYNIFKESNKNNDKEEQKEEKIDENKIKEDVVNKIYKILPQDIIAILPKNNIIKKKYLESEKYNNFKDYINKGDYKKFKISIIYTFTGIGKVEGLNFNISEIRSEKGFKIKIDELKNRNENNQAKQQDYICMHFEQNNSKKIKFITNLILYNLEEKEEEQKKYRYIIIVHINRNFSEKGEMIYSLPDINPDINQLFIDNYEIGNKITLRDILSKDFKTLLEEKKEDLKLEEEFYKTLKNFLKNEINDKEKLEIDNKLEYIKGIIGYIKESESIKESIMDATYRLIDKNNDDENSDDIIDKIFKKKLINKFTVDIVSCIIDYIKEEIFSKYLKKIFVILEDNNILTTLSELYQRDFKDIDKKVVEEIVIDFLKNITFDKNNYNCKFLYNFNIPGLYNFYINISEYIEKNIKSNYFDNEKKLRYLLKEDAQKIMEFHNKEDELLESVFKEIEKNKYSFNILNKISTDLIFKDYVTYYLKKYKEKFGIYNKDDIYHKIIELLIKLRFNKENRLMKSNKNINILLIKIIWIESNINYILSIYKIIENAMNIYQNHEDDENKLKEKLYKTIADLINKENIKYITNEKKNPKHTKEVNECFYILLASLCYCITSDEIKLIDISDNKSNKEIQIEINEYCDYLKEINKIMQNLNDELYIYLNEMYIIDELIKIIEIFKKIKGDDKILKINEIKNIMRENAEIIQKFALNNDKSQLSDRLIINFEEMYNKMSVEEENKDKDYYDKLRYILFKEIKKVSDMPYRYKILIKILSEKEIIKKSNNIFQILLKNYLKIDKYEGNRKKILDGDDNIITYLEKEVSNNSVLEISLLYLFEKNSLIYILSILTNKKEKEKDKIYFDDEPLSILKDCIESLENYKEKKKGASKKNKEISKLFCISYIKTFINTFIKMFKEKEPKWRDPANIINIINENNNTCKMIRIYVYKILYNNYKIDFFFDEENISNYKLEEYTDYKDFINIEDLSNMYKLDYKIKTIKDSYFSEATKVIEKYKKDDFQKQIKSTNYDLEEYGIDNFYMASFNLMILNSHIKKTDINKNFFDKICKPLFEQKQLLLKAIELFYNPDIYEKIKNDYKINSNNNMSFLFGYRFCINVIFSENNDGIYHSLYEEDKINYLKEKFYPGNDAKVNLVYSQILDHFKTKPEEGCYICLCKDWFYHSVPSGFPGKLELNQTCPRCSKNIGSMNKFLSKDIKIVKREGYYRIFKNENEIEEMKKNIYLRQKLKEINYLTLEEFIKKYVYKTEKGGIYSSDANFKNSKKVIRNLSQVSYRLLNYILYSNLFFAKLIVNKKDFDSCLPKKMSWEEILSESWNILKNELLNENIDSIEEFMNYIFSDLFLLLNSSKKLDNYEDLIEFENNLEQKIQKLIKEFKNKEIDKEVKENEIEEDKTTSINLLKEKYTSEYYDKNDFPFYEYFYFTDYLNEKYINEKLSLFDLTEYPVLKQYLDDKINDTNEDNKYTPNNLLLFNSALNLINQAYFNNISRDQAEKKKLKTEEIYIKNKELIDKFIEFYNSLGLDEKELKIENNLSDFFIDDTNNFGKNYKMIYQKFIEEYNKIIGKLFDIKIDKGILEANYKNYVNIQNIDEKELFTLNLPKKNSFIEILFNASYRKILDTVPINYKFYKEYVINYDYIEEIMTELLLKNKKLLNENLTEFIYNNEVFNNQITNIITLLREKYKNQMSIYDKVSIYKFCKANNNQNLYRNILNDFVTLIKYLNSKDKEAIIKEEVKIYEVIKEIKDSTSKDFIKLFEQQNELTIGKLPEIFDYYLKVIADDITKEIKKYQVNLDKNSKDIISIYYKKDHYITKKDLAYSIRLFISLVLFTEEEKSKIKSNTNNIIKYLTPPDLWKKDIYSDVDNFNKNLNELKSMNLKINQIYFLYDALGKDIEKNYFDDVIEKIKNEEGEEEEEEEGDEEEKGGDDENDDRE